MAIVNVGLVINLFSLPLHDKDVFFFHYLTVFFYPFSPRFTTQVNDRLQKSSFLYSLTIDIGVMYMIF